MCKPDVYIRNYKYYYKNDIFFNYIAVFIFDNSFSKYNTVNTDKQLIVLKQLKILFISEIIQKLLNILFTVASIL